MKNRISKRPNRYRKNIHASSMYQSRYDYHLIVIHGNLNFHFE